MKNVLALLLLFCIALVISCSSEKEGDLLDSCDDFTASISKIVQPSCTGAGSVEVSTNGGETPFLYTNDSQENSTGVIEKLQAGSYTVGVVDAKECTAMVSVTLDSDGDVISVSVTPEPENCTASDGAIAITATGGSGVYSYSLDGGESVSSSTFSNLQAGSYEVEVVDDQGCSTTTTAVVGNDIGDLSATINVVESGCKTSEGTITINATGGDGSYTFSLDNGSSTTDNVFSGLVSGSYEISYTDGNGCSESETIEVLSGVSLTDDIAPIISQNCATSSGCHASGASGRPVLETKAQIMDRADRIKARTGDGSMPQGGSLTQTQIDMIACWVDDGAKDN